MAESAEELQRRKRRRRLIRGLVIGGAALGLPALFNTLVARRARRIAHQSWGHPQTYPWRNGNVSFQDLGDGPPVLCLHSLGAGHSSLEWRQVATRLAERHRVLVPDLLGWGESDRPALVYDGQLYIDLVVDLIGDLTVEPTVVVASGLTAAYAVQAAADHPELISALGLVSPVGIDLYADEPDLKDAIFHRLLRLPVVGTSALNAFTSKAGLAAHLRKEIHGGNGAVDLSLIDAYYRLSHLPGAGAALAAYLSGYLNHPVREALERIRCPVWLGWGRRARTPTVASADLWLHGLPEAELEVFEGSAAAPQLAEPEAVARALDDFITRLPT
jgi:pimeloyl-ACP methyl ester carboxylesterase